MNRLLARQLRRTGCDPDKPPQDAATWKLFLERIHRAYEDTEADRYTLERAMDLSSKELRDALDEAKRATKAKSAFLANMSHELRTPMNGVIGVADVLAGTRLDADQAQLVDTIRRSGDALLLLVNDVLDLAKIEAGGLELHDSEFCLRELADDVCDLFAETSRGKGVELSCHVHDDIAERLSGDPDRIRQVLLNLVGNAIKFSPEGHVLLTARTLMRDASHDIVWFEVRDDGIGIDKTKTPDLFTPFSQADSSTTRQFGGTGLGLSICKQLVEVMGGEIGYESSPEKGTTFWFYIRLQPQSPAPPLHSCRTELKNKRVLFVDDHPVNRQVFQWKLRSLGVQVETVGDAPSAMQILAEQDSFDLVVLDYLMPDQDGLQLAQRIRAEGLADGTPLMLHSTSRACSGPAFTEVFDDILHTPVRKKRLEEAVIRLISPLQGPISQRGPHRPHRDAMALRILLAEDNPINQRVAGLMLDTLGCEVTLATNGEEVVERFRGEHFDLILMDCHMPVMNGFDATRAIRGLESASGSGPTPIIALTADGAATARTECLASGMTEFLTKPLRMEMLEQRIRSVVPCCNPKQAR